MFRAYFPRGEIQDQEASDRVLDGRAGDGLGRFGRNLKVQEELVSYVIQRVLEEKKNELETIKRDTGRLENIKPPFPRISYDEAVEILHKCGVEFEWGNDFGGGDETVLAEQFELPVFV